MLTKLPEILGRNFIVGFFVPASLFIIFAGIISKEFSLFTFVFTSTVSTQSDALILTTNIGLLSFFVSIMLLSFNREIIRFFEGYGRLNPLCLLSGIERANFKRVKRDLLELDDSYHYYSGQGEILPLNLRQKRNFLLMKLADRFPDDERWLLPTSFGNTIRSFEVYSRIMYGIDSIPSWSRILSVIPTEYITFIEEAKTKVDLWINILTLDILLLVESCTLFLLMTNRVEQWKLITLIVIESLLAIIAYLKAQSSAVEWGNFIKASFDLFLPDLCDRLGLDNLSSTTPDEQREIWRKLSQAIIYGNPQYMPSRNNRPR